MSSFAPRPALMLAGSLILVSAAHAQSPVPPLVQTGDPFAPLVTSKPMTQSDFASQATTQISFLSAIRDWRDTMRGGGKLPVRNFAPAPLGKKFGFALGNVSAPISGAGAGIAAHYSALEIGSTAQPDALNGLIAGYDSMMTGTKVVAPDQTQMTWLRAHPFQGKNSDLQLSMSRGRRDMQAGKGENWLNGNFQNANGRINLPANWSLRGNFTREQLEKQTDAANAWNVDATGPLAHPFGVAQAHVNYTDTDAGYTSLADPTTAAVGQKAGLLEVTQPVAIGPVSGNLKVAATSRERAEDNAHTGDEIAADGTNGQAQMRVAVTPNLALISSGSLQMNAVTRALQDQNSSATAPVSTGDDSTDMSNSISALLTPSEALELSQQLTGDVGMEWKFTRALSVAVSAGVSRGRAQNETGDLWNDGPGSNENRRSVEIRHKTSAADLRLQLAQRSQRSILANASGPEAQISQWRVEAARRLVGSVHLKTIVDVARDGSTDLSAHRYEAQIQLARAARLDARYREGNVAPGLLSDDWASTFAAPDGSARQWSARFNAGSAAAGSGLGMALEYARSAGSNPDVWRVGFQFK